MKVTFFSTQPYDKVYFERHNSEFDFNLNFLELQLTEQTAVLADGSDAICAFVNDSIGEGVLRKLSDMGISIVALRCAGFNNVNLQIAAQLGIHVVRVPAYSPHAVAEHAVAMIMTLNRKTHKAYNRIREQNFSLNGLIGFDLFNKTVGVIGTGNIGEVFCKIMTGFGCRILAYDVHINTKLEKLGVNYVSLNKLFSDSDIVSLHCPLNEQTRYLINQSSIDAMKNGVMIINTSRGGLIDTRAILHGLKSGKIGSLGIDVYEQEEKLFFRDLSDSIIEDDMIIRLSGFPNVLITAHQGFFTHEALTGIARTTLQNLLEFKLKKKLTNEVKA